jgi:transposase InsO family protein
MVLPVVGSMTIELVPWVSVYPPFEFFGLLTHEPVRWPAATPLHTHPEEDMAGHRKPSPIPLPKGWKRSIKSAVVQLMSLARFAFLHASGSAGSSPNRAQRLAADHNRLDAEVALLREELRLKDARMVRIAPQHRPHYAPTERLAILELRAARGWSLERTARAFLVTAATIASWMHRLEEQGADTLVKLPEPVIRFPELVRYAVQRLKTLCPALGKVKIAQILARAGLHLCATTVGRILKERRQSDPPAPAPESGRVVTAKRPNHVWHIDLTLVPTALGFWTTWLPFALPQCWPFCWWLGVVIDHFSRRVLGCAVFKGPPTSLAMHAFLGRTIAKVAAAPKYLICDKCKQFWCERFKDRCHDQGIALRFGAVGQYGSLAILERLILTLKVEGVRSLVLVPLLARSFRHELRLFIDWYNGSRPHMALAGRTP